MQFSGSASGAAAADLLGGALAQTPTGGVSTGGGSTSRPMDATERDAGIALLGAGVVVAGVAGNSARRRRHERRH